MSGTLDGVNTRDPVGYSPYEQAFEPNISLRMENTGNDAIVNPWIIVNGKRDWRSIDRILEDIIHAGMSDAEKARAIWEFARTHRYHYTCATDEVKDTVKMLNVYGYTLCWDEAYTVSNLWQAAGLKVRRGYPHGHCTTEVWFDGAWHLLDSDEHLLYLLRDNQTIASESHLAEDRDLVKRGHAYGVLQGEDKRGAEGAASLFFFTGQRTGGRQRIGNHTMDLTLRPGESLVWEWEDRGKYHGYWERPKRLANGRMQYEPDLSTLERWTDEFSGWDVRGDGIESTGDAAISIPIRSPYVVVGATLTLEGDTSHVEASVVLDNEEPIAFSTNGGTASLDAAFPSGHPAVYEYRLRLVSRSSCRITRLQIESDLQMAPLSLPALELGTNEIQYTSDSGGQVLITHEWTERDAEPAPSAPSVPVFPEDGAQTQGTQFTLAWSPAIGASDYHIQLSDRPDTRYALSPVFDKLVSKTPSVGRTEWEIPFEGLLNPDQTYYWRVRPRTSDGLWRSWSPVWSFVPNAPAIPTDLDLRADYNARTLTLSWKPGRGGTTPNHYEIYGSDERGFSVSREPYEVVVSNKQTETFPSNLVATTDDTVLVVCGPEADLGNHAFFRVIAVDADGVRSGPSDQASAPRPMIVSRPPSTAEAGQSTTYQLRVTSAIGELRAERIENKNYVQAFRESDELRFLVDEGPPEWVSIDEHSGLFTATPGPEHLGFHTITIRVQNGRGGGTDMQGFDLEVIPPADRD